VPISGSEIREIASNISSCTATGNGLYSLLDEGRDQLLSPALERYPPQALRKIKPTALEDGDHSADAIGLCDLPTEFDGLEAVVLQPLLLMDVFDVRLHPVFLLADPLRSPFPMQRE